MTFDARRALELVRAIEDTLKLEENSVPSWTIEEVQPFAQELAAMLTAEVEDIDAAHAPPPSMVLETIRDMILQARPGARLAVFGADEWDNGYFFALSRIRVLGHLVDDSDEDDVEIEGLDEWEADLTHEIGNVGRGTILILDLRTLDWTETSVYAVEAELERMAVAP
jgi:hypothetical protein